MAPLTSHRVHAETSGSSPDTHGKHPALPSYHTQKQKQQQQQQQASGSANQPNATHSLKPNTHSNQQHGISPGKTASESAQHPIPEKKESKKHQSRDMLLMTQSDVDKRLKSLRRRAKLLDSQFTCCGIFRFGLESLIGLIPVIGDFAGVILAVLFVNAIRRRFNLPKALISQMFINIAIDFITGLVPILGDILDMFYKANLRNYKIVEQHIGKSRESARSMEEGNANGAYKPSYIPRLQFKDPATQITNIGNRINQQQYK